MYKKHKLSIIIALCLPLQMIIVRFLAKFPHFVEQWYSNGMYPIISKGFRYVFGWLPFSFGDIMYVVLICIALREMVLLFKNRFKTFKLFIIKTAALASIVYGTFYILWGMNYYRLPLHESLGIEKEYTTEELVALAEKLIIRSNALHTQLGVNDTVQVIFGANDRATYRDQVFEQTLDGYTSLKSKFPTLNYPPSSIKNSLLRYPLSIMGYSGYLNPITNEAHINGMVPAHRWPVVSCHEQAHQLGFAKENEANFIAVMATQDNKDLYFKYSGSIFALRYCINDLYRRDKVLGEQLTEKMHSGIFKSYKASSDFWDKMDNPLEPVFDLFYGNYLKANNQPAGLKSYSYMVALLVNYDKKYPDTF